MKDVTNLLAKKINEQQNVNHSNEALVWLMTYHKCKMFSDFLSESANRPLLAVLLRSMMLDKPSIEDNKILFFEYEDSIKELCNQIVHSSIPISEWIYVVPVIHLVTKQCNPFDTLQNTSWDFNETRKW